MNWITKIIKAGEKIKSAIHKRATKEDIENSTFRNSTKNSSASRFTNERYE